MKANRIILFGIPRSGTTWLSEILSHNQSFRLIHEPDNEANSFLGLTYKSHLPRFPFLTDYENHDQYNELFKASLNRSIKGSSTLMNAFCFKLFGLDKAKIQENLSKFNTGNQSTVYLKRFISRLLLIGPKHQSDVLIKSVHGFLNIPFLLRKNEFTPVFIYRHPLNIYSSYKKMGMADQNRAIYANDLILETFEIPKIDPLKENSSFIAGYQIGTFYKAMDTIIANNSKIKSVNYEEIIRNPIVNLKAIFNDLSIEYTDDTESFINSKFRKGEGYETNRDPKEQFNVYKRRLNSDEIDNFCKGYKKSYGSINFEY